MTIYRDSTKTDSMWAATVAGMDKAQSVQRPQNRIPDALCLESHVRLTPRVGFPIAVGCPGLGYDGREGAYLKPAVSRLPCREKEHFGFLPGAWVISNSDLRHAFAGVMHRR